MVKDAAITKENFYHKSHKLRGIIKFDVGKAEVRASKARKTSLKSEFVLGVTFASLPTL